MKGGRGDREVSAVRKWKDGGMEIGASGGERLQSWRCRVGGEIERL